MSRPPLFLDVDGPLNPYAAQPERRPEGYTTIRVPLRSRRPPRVWLNPAHGRELPSLGYELCWATTWMAEANRWIAPLAVGRGALPACAAGQLWLCRMSFRPPQTALFGRASTAPVTELRRKRMLEAPLRSRALTICPSGMVTRVPAVT